MGSFGRLRAPALQLGSLLPPHSILASRDCWPPGCPQQDHEDYIQTRAGRGGQPVPAPSPASSITITLPLPEGTRSLLSPCGPEPLNELQLMRPFAETLECIHLRWSRGPQAGCFSCIFSSLEGIPRRPGVLAASLQTPIRHFIWPLEHHKHFGVGLGDGFCEKGRPFCQASLRKY